MQGRGNRPGTREGKVSSNQEANDNINLKRKLAGDDPKNDLGLKQPKGQETKKAIKAQLAKKLMKNGVEFDGNSDLKELAQLEKE